MPSLRPDAGILTNITPDHLDRHGSMDNYAAVKGRMFARQHRGDTAIVSVDDKWCAAIAEHIHTGATVRHVSVERALDDGISAQGGILRDIAKGKAVAEIDLREMPALRGAHNWQNACMAYGAAKALGLATEEIARGFRSFPGLAHRMQQVGKLGRVSFVNDSKATNADAAAKALSSFDRIYWIAGGQPKSGGIESLAPWFPCIRKAYLIGQAAEAFAETLGECVPHAISTTLDRAVTMAAEDAAQEKDGAPVVLLSPACASFDQYPNFEVRGDAFVKAVASLPGVTLMTKGAT
jgi:UDP-N-acetylmuramoylalanine--D-glutamate ligase